MRPNGFAPKLLLITFGVVIALAASVLYGWWQVDGPGASSKGSNLPLSIAQMDFSLTDHKGNQVRPVDWIGKPMLVFFGFTYCPVICPTTLIDITGWLNELDDDSTSIGAAFITVDPERDTPAELSEYLESFHPTIIGYTGSTQAIADAAAGFRVKYKKIESDQTYTMDHTAGVFIYDAAGRFVSMIDLHEPKENAVPKIRRAL